MNMYERMEDEACEDGIDIIDCDFTENIKGLYCDGVIGINKKLDTTEKACVMAEELGHHHTSVGNILDMSIPGNRKQERQARIWGYNRLIGLAKLAEAYEHGCRSYHETAEYLEVTPEYLAECVECYRDKYGDSVTVGDYIIMFIPYLAVFKRI